jgi:hypothetical protein
MPLRFNAFNYEKLSGLKYARLADVLLNRRDRVDTQASTKLANVTRILEGVSRPPTSDDTRTNWRLHVERFQCLSGKCLSSFSASTLPLWDKLYAMYDAANETTHALLSHKKIDDVRGSAFIVPVDALEEASRILEAIASKGGEQPPTGDFNGNRDLMHRLLVNAHYAAVELRVELFKDEFRQTLVQGYLRDLDALTSEIKRAFEHGYPSQAADLLLQPELLKIAARHLQIVASLHEKWNFSFDNVFKTIENHQINLGEANSDFIRLQKSMEQRLKEQPSEFLKASKWFDRTTELLIKIRKSTIELNQAASTKNVASYKDAADRLIVAIEAAR